MRSPAVTRVTTAAGYTLMLTVLVAVAYTASAVVWMQNDTVFSRLDGAEVTPSFWNLIPASPFVGEAEFALAAGTGALAVVVLAALVLPPVLKQCWRTMRVMTFRLVTPRSKR